MPTRRLTDLFVERVKAPNRGRAEYFDAAFPGLALRVTSKGAKSWSVFYRLHGRLRRFTIGSYPPIKPKQARVEADAALAKVRAGADPAEEKRIRRERRQLEDDTFGAVARDYLERHHKRNNRASTYEEFKRDMEHDAIARWEKRPIASITRGDVIDLIDRIIARGAEVQANRTLTRLQALFRWAVEKDRVTMSPAAGMKRPTQERSRDRVLSDDEIRWVWQACDAIGWPFGSLAKLLLLTGQRRDEVASMERAELDLAKRVWTIPGERAKNGVRHEVHISDATLAVLQSLERVGNRFTLTTNGEAPIAGFSRTKRRIDAEMLKARRASLGLPVENDDYRKATGIAKGKPLPIEIPNWTFHDLRRTAATGMARLNFPPHVVGRVLNHTAGSLSGITAIYARHEYLAERRAALDAWGRFVSGLLTEAPANVVALRA